MDTEQSQPNYFPAIWIIIILQVISIFVIVSDHLSLKQMQKQNAEEMEYYNQKKQEYDELMKQYKSSMKQYEVDAEAYRRKQLSN